MVASASNYSCLITVELGSMNVQMNVLLKSDLNDELVVFNSC